MPLEFDEFDRDGDLLLLLTSKVQNECPSAIEDEAETPEDDSAEHAAAGGLGDGNTDIQADTANSNLEDSSLGIDNVPAVAETDTASECLPIEARPVATDIHMLVSSKALMLASPVFKAMLGRGTFQEGRELQAAGKVSIPLPDDNPNALRIILDIVHLRNRQVPKSISIETLIHLSVLVDKYQMLEAVETYVDIWIRDKPIKSSLPEKLGPLVHPWLSIAWVFNLSDEFRVLTRILMQWEVPSKLGTELSNVCEFEGVDLPIPEVVMNRIWSSRMEALAATMLLMENTIKKYGNPIRHCNTALDKNMNPLHPAKNSACDAQMLGSLLRESARIGIWPPPSPPYHGLSWSKTCDSVWELPISCACDTFPWSPTTSTHGVVDMLITELRVLDGRMKGLLLKDYK